MSANGGSGHRHHPGGVASHATRDGNARRLAISLGLILLFMAFEIGAGLIAHSLALLSDAAHMLTDAGALGLSLVAIRLAARPASGAMTYGLRRVEILSAQTNGVTLLVLAALIVFEAVRRLISPPSVGGMLVVAVALAGIVVNVAATAVLAGADRTSLNIRGSFQHLLTDLYGFIATAIAGGVILWTGFRRADAVASLIVAALMLRAAYGLLRDSGRIFMEAAPKDIDVESIGRALAAQPDVRQVHDLHVWEVTSGFPALSAHIVVASAADHDAVLHDAQRVLREHFGIDHCTLQVDRDHASGPLRIHRAGCPYTQPRTSPLQPHELPHHAVERDG